VDAAIHKEVLDRYSKLNIAPYRGFIQPRLDAVNDDQGNIIDVKVAYPNQFLRQMMFYGKSYSFLPAMN
jgi:dipeptidyl-peptidase-3